MTAEEREAVVAAYLKYLEWVRMPAELPTSREEMERMIADVDAKVRDNPHVDGWEEVEWLTQHDPQTAWSVFLESIARCDPQDLSTIGAGSLETFVSDHGVQFLHEILREIADNERFREAFRFLNLGSDFPAEEGRRINQALVDQGVPEHELIDWWAPNS